DPVYGSLIYADGDLSGFVTGSAYGHRIGHAVALGYVKTPHAAVGRSVEISILGERRMAEIIEDSPYDPDNTKLRG
ncbi:MAG: glycine cleavage T C-terminal barrel domain-containing protein, partial [Pseudomonadota bacterium]